MIQRTLLMILAFFAVGIGTCWSQEKQEEKKQATDTANSIMLTFDSAGIKMVGDLYAVDENKSRPIIVLCHQAGWSRGEYKEIAPKLNALGFHCLAIDQRSGGTVNDTPNLSLANAKEAGLGTNFVDAEADMLSAINYVRDQEFTGKVILWGSSYSSALALRIAGENPDLVDGVLSFAPGEYFTRFDKPEDWITSSAKKITVPTFITSAKNEFEGWSAIFEAIPGDQKVKFVPETDGNHGSRALWEKFDDHKSYWDATEKFLQQFLVEDSSAKANDTHQSHTLKPISDLNTLPTRIAFGSCGHQDKPQPILNTIVDSTPDLFIYLGDNIYGDTKDMEILQGKYDQLAAKPEFQNLGKNVPVLAVWDDHDYGWNDAGKEYEFKAQSKQIFMDFWQIPEDSPRRTHDGIYGSHRFEVEGKALQLILLDTRTFRDSLKTRDKNSSDSQFKNAYQPDDDSEKTMLGQEQWDWLETVLKVPADLRIICSSIQFGHEYNGWESWTNLPNEQQKMVQLIRDTEANGVIFISGDVHWGEISKREFEGLYPIYDVTASGLTEEWYNVEPNKFRVGEAFRANHFGILQIDWATPSPTIVMKIIDQSGETQCEHQITLADISSNQ